MTNIEVRCPKCNRLQFRITSGIAVIEGKCDKCKTLYTFPTMRTTVTVRVKPTARRVRASLPS